ncbi:hypothetical protein CU102_15215 [Phyllobacterium brassicacearum]|uniref:Uncharacterized protein n=1 Tax=Phyllobacterium brassicacearum TaxID=314235 RepID=A0A2P7BN77_9HYPH|nr:hypothetical protein CU102_15215 [Phyllobacterium brassicacearum]
MAKQATIGWMQVQVTSGIEILSMDARGTIHSRAVTARTGYMEVRETMSSSAVIRNPFPAILGETATGTCFLAAQAMTLSSAAAAVTRCTEAQEMTRCWEGMEETGSLVIGAPTCWMAGIPQTLSIIAAPPPGSW